MLMRANKVTNAHLRIANELSLNVQQLLASLNRYLSAAVWPLSGEVATAHVCSLLNDIGTITHNAGDVHCLQALPMV